MVEVCDEVIDWMVVEVEVMGVDVVVSVWYVIVEVV